MGGLDQAANGEWRVASSKQNRREISPRKNGSERQRSRYTSRPPCRSKAGRKSRLAALEMTEGKMPGWSPALREEMPAVRRPRLQRTIEANFSFGGGFSDADVFVGGALKEVARDEF